MTDFSSLLADLRALQDQITMDRRHVYRVRGEYAPNVTTIIKVMDAPMLDQWKVKVQVEATARAAFANPPWSDEGVERYAGRLVSIAQEQYEHERISQEAADLGKQVHALIEHEVRRMLGQTTSEPAVSEEALFIFSGWKDWAKSVALKPLMAEGKIFHSPAQYTGTFDLLALVEDRPSVLDWKAKKGDAIYPEMRLQSAAYREALHSMGWPPLAGYIVRLPKTGGAIVSERLEDDIYLAQVYDSFLCCLKLYRWQAALRKAR